MFSASEISKIAEVEVSRGAYYDGDKRPIANGLLDPKMVHFLTLTSNFADFIISFLFFGK